MKKHLSTRLLSLLLIVAMLAGYAVPVQAVAHDHAAESSETLSFTKLENSSDLELLNEAEDTEEAPPYADTEMVRVSIVLDEKSTLEKGFSTENIAANTAAMSYRNGLKAQQKAMAARIGSAIGTELDVVRNLTLVANVISANVAYGSIDEIAAVPGVKEVFLETRYEPAVLDQLHVDAAFNAESLYINSKIAFGYHYIDEDNDIVHDNDTQGSHGSHVSGIATANSYIPNEDGTTTVGIRELAPIFNDKNGYMDLVGGYNPYQMFWDHDKEILYMVRNYATNVSAATQSILYTIDVTTGQPAVVNAYQPEGVEGGTSGLLYNYVYGTFVVPSGDSLLLPGNQATEGTPDRSPVQRLHALQRRCGALEPER